MSWDEFKAALNELDLSQRQFAHMIRASSPMSVNKWRNKPHVPGYAEALIRLMQAMRAHDAAWAEAEIGALLPKPKARIEDIAEHAREDSGAAIST